MLEFLKENWELLSGVVASVVAFLGGKKSKEIQEKKDNSDALQGIQHVYEKFVEQTDRKFDSMQLELDTVKSLLKSYISQCSKCENNKIT